MKKIVKISLVLLVVIGIVTNVYASSCNVSLQPSKSEVKQNEEFVVDVVLSNIQDDKGMITLTATLDYDRNNLTFVKIDGQNSWKPSYNEENGKIAAERNEYTKNNETIFKITFKVKEKSQQSVGITLKDIIFSNGDQDIDVTNATTTLLLANNEEPTKPDNNQNTNTIIDTPTNNNSTTNKIDDTTVKKEKLPQTGDMDIVLFALGGIAVLTTIFFIKVKIIDKNIKQ